LADCEDIIAMIFNDHVSSCSFVRIMNNVLNQCPSQLEEDCRFGDACQACCRVGEYAKAYVAAKHLLVGSNLLAQPWFGGAGVASADGSNAALGWDETASVRGPCGRPSPIGDLVGTAFQAMNAACKREGT
jgi:AraC-like DNA-binding protein